MTRPRRMDSGTPASVSFIAGTQIPTTGVDDDETEPVMGDFNGDGNEDVAKIVSTMVGQTSTYEISVVLGNGDGTFKTAQLTATPSDSDDPIVVGDVNGDGNDDILMIHPEGDDCSDARKLSAKPQSVKPQDECGSTVDVLLSNGDGTFAAPHNYFISENGLNGGVLADINGDGKLDVVTVDNQNPANVVVLLGNGDGTFQAETTYATLSGPAPNGLFFADFNGDGKLDFAGDSDGQVQVYLATGSGSFASPASLSTADGQYNSCYDTAGDLNGDGKPEIVSVNCWEDTVTVYVNNGDGSFATGVYYDSNFNGNNFPSEATIADLDGDGNGDIVVGNARAGNISIFLGHGDGTFTVEPVSYATGGNPWTAPLVADFNGDGLADVVIPDDNYSLIYLQGYGDGGFRAGVDYQLPNSFSQKTYSASVATGDFNGDGIPDMVVGQFYNDGSTGVVVYLAKGDGTFYPGVSYGASDSLGFVAVADFNGDGKLDIAAIDSENCVVQIFLGNGDGTFSTGLSFADSGPDLRGVVAGTRSFGSKSNGRIGGGGEGLVTGDFNHDGKVDLAILSFGNIGVLLGNGDGTFQGVTTYEIPDYDVYCLASADINGDGYLDLAVCAETDDSSAIAILLANNDNSGTFQPPLFVSLTGDPNFVAFGDMNKDGKTDMAITMIDGTYQGEVEIALGNGDGTFQTPTDYPSSVLNGGLGNPVPVNIQMYDINGDGNLDAVYLNGLYGSLAVMLGNGDGTFSAPTEFPTTTYTGGMALADVNNDGAVDVLVGNDESGGVSVLLNANGSGTAPNFSVGTSTPSATVTAGGAGTYTLNLAGTFGYNGTITFTCSNLPAGATCSFSPTSVVAQGVLPLTTTVTINTTAATATLLRPYVPASGTGSRVFLASLSTLGLFGLVLMSTGKKGSGKKPSQRVASVLIGGMVLLMMCTLVGCGSSSSKTVTSTGTPAGSYVVTVTSTGTGTGAPTHSMGLALVVQ